MSKPRPRKAGRRAKAAEPSSASVSGKLAVERTRAKISRAEMAGQLGWSELKIWRIETGRQRPLADDVAAYARILSVPVGRFYDAA